jgi:putative endonuclease
MEGDSNYRRRLGKLGEDIACALLENMGHTILERNWRSGHLEIDLISLGTDGIHFVEVKTRRLNIQAPPQENVDRTKQARIIRAAGKYLKSGKGTPYGCLECMFDVVAITFEGNEAKTEWFPQAYIPIYL